MEAAQFGHTAAVSALLAAGAKVDIEHKVSIMGDIGGMTTVPCMFAWWLE